MLSASDNLLAQDRRRRVYKDKYIKIALLFIIMAKDDEVMQLFGDAAIDL